MCCRSHADFTMFVLWGGDNFWGVFSSGGLSLCSLHEQLLVIQESKTSATVLKVSVMPVQTFWTLCSHPSSVKPHP